MAGRKVTDLAETVTLSATTNGKSNSSKSSKKSNTKTTAKAKSSGKSTTKTTNTAKAISVSKPTNVPDYVKTTVAPAEYVMAQYTSPYEAQLNAALDKVANWNYDPLKDANYQALAKVYDERGNIAAKNSLADAAALNGGYGTSYAVSAAQQARNQYNQELAAMIPELENTAYNRATGTLGALREADNTQYGRFRDTEGDKQWKYTQDYQKYRDEEADNQWAWTSQYNKYRDLMGDYQFGLNYNYQIGRDKVSDNQWAKEYALKKGSASGGSGGGGGGGSRSGGGGGYSGGYSGGMPITREDLEGLRGGKITTNALEKNIAERANGSKVTLGAGHNTTKKKK